MKRLIVSFLAAVLGVLLTAVFAAPSDAAGAPQRPSIDQLNERGFDELNACLASRQRVDALYVLDVSGSLQFNDPDGQRFEALEASVSQLSTLAGEGADGREVNVAVATFGNGFTTPSSIHDWSRVPGRDSISTYAARVRGDAEAAWQAAGTNQGTNYEAALEGAARMMRGRGSTDDACQMVLWFTDGLFALGDPYRQSATDAASARMCARGGTLDTLRRDGVSVIALALTGEDIAEQLAQPEYRPRRGELAAMALGQSPEKRCGTTPVPSGSRPGIYLTADQPAVLGALFSGVAAQAAGCVPSSIQTTLPARFPVDAGVGRFQVDLSLSASDQTLRVQAPGERPVDVPPGATSYAGAEIQLTRTGNLASLQVALSGSAVRGRWSVAGPATQPSSISFYRCSDLRIDIPVPDRALPGGEESTVAAVVTDSSGEPVDLEAYKGLSDGSAIEARSAQATSVAAQVSDASRGEITVTVVPPENRLSIDVDLAFTPVLADAGSTELSPVTASAVLPVAPPGSYPAISPATTLDLGTSQGVDPASGTWTVRGSSQGPSRVCFGPAGDVDAPAAAGDIAVAVSVECQDLAKGETLEVRVTATPAVTADGEAGAHVPVTLENADGEQIQEDLEVRWELERRVDQGLRLQILLLALAVSLLVPLLVLALVNYLLARFRSGDVRFGTFPVEIGAEGDLRPLEPVGVRGLMSRFVQGQERRRIANVGAGIDLIALASKNPLGSPRFAARSAGGSRVVSGDATITGRALECDVTPGLGAVWVLVVADGDLLIDDPERATPATLLLVTREEGQDQIDRLVTRARVALSEGRWPRVRRELAEIVGQAARSNRGGSETRSAAGGAAAESASPGADDDPFGLDTGSTSHTPQTARRSAHQSTSSPDTSSDDTYEDPFA